jgi:hypothetical protein
LSVPSINLTRNAYPYCSFRLLTLVGQLITVAPHLHPIASLHKTYRIPCTVIHTSDPILNWIKEHIPDALLIGSDEESEQWISAVV